MISNYFCNKYNSIYRLYNINVNNFRLHSLHYGCRYFSSLSENSESEITMQESTDSIIKKYTKMLHNLAISQANEEIYRTNFGSVRFDIDSNTQKMHKNFMKSEIHKDNSDKNNLNKEKTTKSDAKLNYIDEVFFNPIPGTISTNIPLKNTSTKRHKLDSLNDVNYVDEQYMKTGSIEIQNGFNLDNNNVSVSSFQDSDLNYIDSQIINSSSQNTNLNTETDIASENAKFNESQKLIEEEHDDLESLFSFEDAITEISKNGFIQKMKSENLNPAQKAINDETRREVLEEQLIDLVEEGNILIQNGTNIHNNKILKTQILNSKTLPDSRVSTSINASDSEVSSKASKDFTKKKRLAYDFVRNTRQEEIKSNSKEIKGEILPHENYKKIILAVPSYSTYTQYDMVQEIRKHILYNDNDIVALNKPYGIPAHGGGGEKDLYKRLNLVTLLPMLAEVMKEEALFPVHRLDLNTTGVMLLAKTNEMADKLKKMFKEHQIKKTYLAITKGIPDPVNGIIDIPVGEGKVDRFQRMVLRPDIPGFRGRRGDSKKTITRYKILSAASGCALVEVNPITGIKHQVRVHLGFGINCPVLGDPKYSFLNKIAPQRLPGDTLQRLGLQKQASSRSLPLHLHSFCVNIPIYDANGRDIYIRVGPPRFFKLTLQSLKLSGRRNRHSNDYSDIIYGYE